MQSCDQRRAGTIGVIQMSPLRSSGLKQLIHESNHRRDARFPRTASLVCDSGAARERVLLSARKTASALEREDAIRPRRQ
jgi:hypothetical protein